MLQIMCSHYDKLFFMQKFDETANRAAVDQNGQLFGCYLY